MATIIGTDENGSVTYVNEPDTSRNLLKNYPEYSTISAEIDDLKADMEPVDIANDLNITEGVNCKSATIIKAVKYGNILYFQIKVAPSTTLSTSGSLRFTLSGVKSPMIPDWKISLGAASPSTLYIGWMHSVAENGDITFACKSLAGSTWAADLETELSGILPIGTLPASSTDENEGNEGGE